MTNPATAVATIETLAKRHGRTILQLATGGYFGPRAPETGRYEAMYEAGITDRAYARSEDDLTSLGRKVLAHALRARRMVEI